MLNVRFDNQTLEDLFESQEFSKSDFEKILKIITQIRRTPYEGDGQPEALKGNLSGYWSRRINQKDRIVYKVNEETETIEIIQLKGHY